MLDPGLYELEVILSGDNVGPLTRAWRAPVPEHWSSNEANMIQAAAVTPVE